MTGAQQHTNRCQTAHPPAYDQWNLTVYYLGVPRQPLMKGLIVSDRLWSAHRLFWNVNRREEERAPWRSGMQRRKRGPHPLGRLTPPQSDMCQVGLDESWENEKKETEERKPFLSLLAFFCTSVPLRSSSPALILSTPFLMVTVRGAHLFCSVVFCCCHSGDASFLCICTSRQG